jgi:hypothetical protein
LFHWRGASERRLERSEPIECGVAVGLRWLVASTIRPVARGKKLKQCVRLLERYQLGLARRANQLLSGERGISDESLERALRACPEINDVGG